jgi:hypothetical protein
MKISISRGSILTLIVAAVLLGTVPSAIWRLIHTRDPYLFTRQFFDDILARLSGPGRLRFIFQPTVAILLGARDGLKDARAGTRPFLLALAFHAAERGELLRSAFASTRDLVCVAILLDMVSQALIFREIRPGAALLVGPVLIAAPYSASRALTNWLRRGKGSQSLPL